MFFTPPEDADDLDDVAVVDLSVHPIKHDRLGISEQDWRQAWLGSRAYRLVECTANCGDGDPTNGHGKAPRTLWTQRQSDCTGQRLEIRTETPS